MSIEHSVHKHWHSRGYLPHFDQENIHQFITYRLADSLPQSKLKELNTLKNDPNLDKEKRIQLEQWLDNGYGSCILKNKDIADIVIKTWVHWDSQRYQLLNWVVMPNHVHLLIKQFNGHPLNKIVGAWKSFSAKAINKSLGSHGNIWAKGYWDRYIRDDEHYQNCNNYINQNPIKAGLGKIVEDWPYLALNQNQTGLS